MGDEHYYAILDDNQNARYTLYDVESIRNFLISYPQVKELFYTGLLGIKISCDIHSGEVKLVDKQETSDYHAFFSKDSFYKTIVVVEKAICLLARYELLRQLFSLQDHGINNVIAKHQVKFNEEVPNNHNHSTLIDRALNEIQKYILPNDNSIFAIGIRLFTPSEPSTQTPAQHAIYLSFKEHDIYQYGIYHINSINNVDQIMQTTRKHMEAEQEQAQPLRTLKTR